VPIILPTSLHTVVQPGGFAGVLKNPVKQTIIAELKLLQSIRVVPVW